jgi:hypothetical protein
MPGQSPSIVEGTSRRAFAGSYPGIDTREGAVCGNNLGGRRAGEEPQGYECGEV